MLPAPARLRLRTEFAATISRGRRGRSGLLVVHLDPAPALRAADPTAAHATRVGFVVSRALGPAVTRNLVKRRLRHLVAARLPDLPAGASVVVRALPAAATASSTALAAALDRALAGALA